MEGKSKLREGENEVTVQRPLLLSAGWSRAVRVEPVFTRRGRNTMAAAFAVAPGKRTAYIARSLPSTADTSLQLTNRELCTNSRDSQLVLVTN